MGLFYSKVDVETIESIESNVLGLIVQLREEELKMDRYVKDQILRALNVYSKLIARESGKGYISGKKTLQLNDWIHQVSDQLQKFPVVDLEYDNGCQRNLDEMKNSISNVENRIKTNKVKDNELVHLFQEVIDCSKQLGAHYLKSSERDSVSVLILKLFVKQPQSKIVTVLNDCSNILDNVAKHFDMFSVNQFNVLNAEELHVKLTEMQKKLDFVEEKLGENIKATEEHIGPSMSVAEKVKYNRFNKGSSDSNEVSTKIRLMSFFDKISEELEEYDTLVNTFCTPSGQNIVEKINSKVSSLVNDRLQSVICRDEETLRRKNQILGQGSDIFTKLKDIDKVNREISKNLETLKCFEEKISSVGDSDSSFPDKKKTLEGLAKEVEQMKLFSHEVNVQRMELLNRIEGFFTIETFCYLKQIKKSVDHYKKYAQQFAFSDSTSIYDGKRTEIANLRNFSDELSLQNHYINQRIRHIQQGITEVLEILEARAKNNRNVISCLEHLRHIQKNLMDENYTKDLNSLNKIRETIGSIHGFNSRIVAKKVEIRQKLQTLASYNLWQ